MEWCLLGSPLKTCDNKCSRIARSFEFPELDLFKSAIASYKSEASYYIGVRQPLNIMNLSISVPLPFPPLPERVGEYRGFDKLSHRMSHPWGQDSCQIPTMSPGPSRGFDKYCAVVTSSSSKCDSMPLKAATTKIGKFQPRSISTAPGLSNLHLGFGCGA